MKKKTLHHCVSKWIAPDAIKFVVLSPESEIEADESMHRHALIALHELLMAEAMEWHENLIKDPKYEDYPEPLISWDLENAIATPLSRDEVRHLTIH